MKKLRVALYVRVSTQEQAKEGYSVDEQIERLNKYADAMGWIIYKVYTDAGFSGANMERPALQSMIRAIKRGHIDKVCVYKLDRLSRSQKDTLELIEDYFLQNNVEFVSMTENFDTSTPFGRAMVGILAVFAQLEREQIKERLNMGQEARAKLGKYHGGSEIIGYDYVNGELVVNEYEKMQIQQIFDMYIKGNSCRAIADALNNAGMHHKYGKWVQNTILRLLSNRAYLGDVSFRGEWTKGVHEPLIDLETFNSAQIIKDKKREDYQKYNRRHGRINSYLGGYLECACCKAKFSKVTRYYTTKTEKKFNSYYACNSRTQKKTMLAKDVNCKNKYWRMDDLDNLIFAEIKKLAFDPDYIAEIKEKKVDNERPALIEKEISNLDNQLSKLMDLYSVGNMPINLLQDKIQDINEKKTKLEHEFENILAENNDILSHEETMKIASSFGDILNNGDFHEIRTVIGTLIDKIEIDNDDITIHWTFI